MPVEIVQFCHEYTLKRLQALPEVAGAEAKLRMDGGKPYVTDNHNFIVDLYFQEPLKEPHAGVTVGTGLLAGRGLWLLQVHFKHNMGIYVLACGVW